MAKKTGKRNQHVAAFISKLLLGAAAVSFAPKLTLAEEIQKDSLDWNAAYYNNSYEKFFHNVYKYSLYLKAGSPVSQRGKKR